MDKIVSMLNNRYLVAIIVLFVLVLPIVRRVAGR